MLNKKAFLTGFCEKCAALKVNPVDLVKAGASSLFAGRAGNLHLINGNDPISAVQYHKNLQQEEQQNADKHVGLGTLGGAGLGAGAGAMLSDHPLGGALMGGSAGLLLGMLGGGIYHGVTNNIKYDPELAGLDYIGDLPNSKELKRRNYRHTEHNL